MGRSIGKGKRFLSAALVLWGHLYPRRVIPVLLYHSVDDSGSVISISPEQFKAQMRYLKYEGFSTISLKEYLNYLLGDEQPSGKKVVITFDDGFKNNYTEAFAVLKKYRFAATIFISTEHIGGTCSWERDKSIPELPMLTWDEIEEMSDYGINFESHACGHRYLSKLSENEARDELMMSKSTIEKRTGRQVDFFCHPYGDWSEQTKLLAKECGYKGAFTRPGFSSMSSKEDLYDLKRIGTAQFSCLEDFKAGLLGTYDWYVKFKEYLGIRRFRDLQIWDCD
ncbi:MAG: polysaccharide deacetylase family protein [Deltaproteobacteria bacterium]|nr:polysaccharide deacetylase family protein [Deltaproteobacteria bacterium]